MHEVTQLLDEIRSGSATARSRLADLVYAELRARAGRYFRRQPRSHTLQPTALVHEAYLRLVGQEGVRWNDRTHFFAACAAVMRNILAEHARRRRTAKRGSNAQRLSVDSVAVAGPDLCDVVALDEALAKLAALNARHARVVECRVFAGMTVPEVADALGVAERTVDSDWAMARAWLAAHLSGGVLE